MRNVKKEPESVWKPCIFYSPLVNNFGPTPPSRCSKGHWESDTVYLQSHLTQPINHQPWAFSHRPRWGGLCAISWKRLTPSAMADLFFFLTFQKVCLPWGRNKKESGTLSQHKKKIVYSDMIWQRLVVSFQKKKNYVFGCCLLKNEKHGSFLVIAKLEVPFVCFLSLKCHTH